jgi:hypothetical protein
MRSLAIYLDIHDTEDEDLHLKEQKRVPGSCEWLLQRQDFVAWRDHHGTHHEKPSQVFWLNGDPGESRANDLFTWADQRLMLVVQVVENLIWRLVSLPISKRGVAIAAISS